jgi:mono/diheme cytochrome c family protein
MRRRMLSPFADTNPLVISIKPNFDRRIIVMKYKLAILTALLISLGLLLVSCSGGSNPASSGAAAADPKAGEGKTFYNQTCFACHGTDGKGLVQGAKDLTTSEFVRSSSDQELVEMVIAGRMVGDPANTSGVNMPPKGGFDFLSESQVEAIVAYLRTLQK